MAALDPGVPEAPQAPPVTFRKFDDIEGQRADIYGGAIQAIKAFKPAQNATHKVEIVDPGYDSEDFAPGLADEKEAILKQRSLHRPLKGTVRLSDAQGNVLDEQRMTIAHVPHVNSRGLFIRNGSPYVLRNQLRLRPGAYTRERKNGGLETHFNVKPGTGRGFRIEMEPEDGVFKMKIGQSGTRLYPLLRELGIPDEDMEKAWGKELFEKNHRAKSGKDDIDLVKVAQKFSKEGLAIKPEEAKGIISDALGRAELDEDTTHLTLGERIKNLRPDVLLKATKKQLDVAQGKVQADNRDSQAFQSIHGADDLVKERLSRDMTGGLRQILWRASREGNLKSAKPGFLNKNVSSLFEGSGLALGVEDVNPVETLDLRQAITRMGEGGIADESSVSREARNVQGSYLGVIDSSRAPESSRMGLDLRLTDAAMKGSDNQLYTTVRNVRTGEMEIKSARELASKVVTFPGEWNSPDKRIPAVKGGDVTNVHKDDVDYEVVHPHNMMARATQLVPFSESVKGGRLLMGARMSQQALALDEGEAPLVQTALPDGTSLHKVVGAQAGARMSPTDGVVTKVGHDFIEVADAAGKRHRVEMYHNFPMSRKTVLHNEPVVGVGTPVTKGQLVAKSNFTDKEGTLAIGRNLRISYQAARGNTMEDAFVISESAARKLATQNMYKSELNTKEMVSTKKDDYTAIYGDKFKPHQLDKLDDNGVIRVGMQVNPGDPLILGIGKREPGPIGAIMDTPKSTTSDKAEIWDHHNPGIVTDVAHTRDGIRVFVKSKTAMTIGSKISGLHGNKGVISEIKPDDQMPLDEQGRPIEAIFNTFGIVSRHNPGALAAAVLGKVAEKTGKPYVLRPFGSGENAADFALKEAEKHGISETETITDPADNRKIPNVFVGNAYVMALQHQAEGKLAARSQASYDANGYPARGGSEGSKRVSLMDVNALVSAGATNFLKDTKLIRGQRNDDYWRQLKMGETPMAPEGSIADEQFKSQLAGAGVLIKEHGTQQQLRPMLDKDVDAMAQHEIQNSKTFDFNTLDPIKGGLFDIGMTGGAGGNRFSKISLGVKVPHPLFVDPIIRILGITNNKLEAVMRGTEELNGKTGQEALESALKGVDLDREIELAKNEIKSGKTSRRDAAVKKLQYLAGLKTLGVAPEELMVSKVAVVPPKYRPVVSGENVDMIHDLNYLYHDLMEAKQNHQEAKKEFGNAGDEYWTIFKAVQAVSGIDDPVTPKSVESGVKGILKTAIGVGASPKTSVFQRRVVGNSVDMVGRGVITADANLDMDSVGIPINMAWNIFKPFVIRRLVQNGTPASEAVQAVQDQNHAAKKALEAEMAERPVVYNRAPALHRYAYTGAWARLVDDDALHMPYATLKSLGADHDGDTENVHIPVTAEAVEDVKNKLMPSKNLFYTGDFETHYEPQQDYVAGLHLAGKMDPSKPVKTFATAEDAKLAYLKGEISARTPVRILKK